LLIYSNSDFSNRFQHIDFNSDEFEESQFDSDSGMSAENFQTIKKFSNSIIYEPPPEFQDNYSGSHSSKFAFHQTTSTAPSTVIRTTHIQSYATRLTQNIVKAAIKTFHNLATKEIHYCEKHASKHKAKKQKENERFMMMSNEYSIYGSDSFLNNYHKPVQLTNGKNSNSNINIVDSGDDDIYDEPNTEYDIIYKDNKNTILCTKRIVRSLEKKKHADALYCNTDELFYEQLRSRSYNNNNNQQQSSADASNKFQSNSFQKKFDKFLRSKFLNTNLTPTTTTSSIFYSFCHHSGTPNVCNASSNPNSKSSLNSRLSSSHNSLTVPTNKADDSIFITQAMSHDQLQGHNIEISDFYNVPLDSDIYTLPIDVINNNDGGHERHRSAFRDLQHHRAMSDNDLLGGGSVSGIKSHKFHRGKNKRSKRKKRSTDHLESNVSRKLSNASGSVVTSHSFSHDHPTRKTNEKLKAKSSQTVEVKTRKNSSDTKVIKGDSNNNNSKYGSTTANATSSTGASTKKSQFSISLNLKQKFCSIFRFRKSHQASPTRTVPNESAEEEKKVNLSTRALPPLPGNFYFNFN
jgi:suppressor of cytokine signaling 7